MHLDMVVSGILDIRSHTQVEGYKITINPRLNPFYIYKIYTFIIQPVDYIYSLGITL